jgi:hypothetical protein
MPESYNKDEFNQKECQVRMNMPHSQTNHPKNEVVPVSRKSIGTMSELQKSTGVGRSKVKLILKWVLTWMQQALILVALIWFYVFFLLDTFFLGG